MAKSEAATGAADSTLTLGDALVLIRFEEDANALASLRRVIEAGNTGELFYYAERIRRDLARRQVSASVTAK